MDIRKKIAAKAVEIAGQIADECCGDASLQVLMDETPTAPDESEVVDKMTEAVEDYQPFTPLSRDEIIRFIHFIKEHKMFLIELETVMNRRASIDEGIVFDSYCGIRTALRKALEKLK
jgi:hypothetical protein